MTSPEQDYSADARLEIMGNALRFVLPSGEYYYNNLATAKAFINGQLLSKITHRPQKMLRSCKGGGAKAPAPAAEIVAEAVE